MSDVSLKYFYVEQVQDVTVLCFTIPRVVEWNSDYVAGELLEVCRYVTSNGPIQVALDLSSIHQVDDSGLEVLRVFQEIVESTGGSAILCRLRQAVVCTITDAGFADLFRTRETYGEAIRTFAN